MRIGRFLFCFHTVVYFLLMFCRAAYVIVILFCYLLTSKWIISLTVFTVIEMICPEIWANTTAPEKNSLLTSPHQKKIKPVQSLSSLGPHWKQCINII